VTKKFNDDIDLIASHLKKYKQNGLCKKSVKKSLPPGVKITNPVEEPSDGIFPQPTSFPGCCF